jgi:peptidoglycan L-alanyl-D-glutamate endopeptidase CwlK
MSKRLEDPRLHPALVSRVRRILAQLEREGTPMLVTDGFRTVAEQQALYAKGRTKPPLGQSYRVTNIDGVRTVSRHQEGRAVDCAFLVNGKLSWKGTLPWPRYGALAEAEGLVWGGRWKSLPDRPHVELPAHLMENDR